MEISAIEKLPRELLDIIFALVNPADWLCIRLTCSHLNECTINSVAEHYFSELTTSLMGSSLQRLENISLHPHFCKSLKVLRIEDKCESLDPHNKERVFCATEVWPRDASGFVVVEQLDIERFRRILKAQLLSLAIIKIRSYQMHGPLLEFCSDDVQKQLHYTEQSNIFTVETACELAKALVGNAPLPVTSIAVRKIDFYCNNEGTYEPDITLQEIASRHDSRHIGNTLDLGPPECWDIIFTISRHRTSAREPLSHLTSADIVIDSYWTKNVMNAPLLESLKLCDKRNNLSRQNVVKFPTTSSAMKLKTLELDDVETSFDEVFRSFRSPHLETLRLYTIRDILAGSQTVQIVPQNLKNIDLRDITMKPVDLMKLLENSHNTLMELTLQGLRLESGSTWRKLLAFFGRNAVALQHFALCRISDPNEAVEGQYKIVYFHGFRRDLLPAHCPGELAMRYRGPKRDRCIDIEYSGCHAGSAMEELANQLT